MQDEATKLKRTSQATEEALVKKIESMQEKERALRMENAGLQQIAEAEATKFNQVKKQLVLTEAKLEQVGRMTMSLENTQSCEWFTSH